MGIRFFLGGRVLTLWRWVYNFCEYTKKHWIVYFKQANCTAWYYVLRQLFVKSNQLWKTLLISSFLICGLLWGSMAICWPSYPVTREDKRGEHIISTCMLVQWRSIKREQGPCATYAFRLLCWEVGPNILIYANGMAIIMHLKSKKILLKDNCHHSSAKNPVEQNLNYSV